jgi:predicted kinase
LGNILHIILSRGFRIASPIIIEAVEISQHPHLILVNGLPGSGKTTLGATIAAHFRLPFIHKDGVKELLFEALGWSDREWSKKLSRASYDLLFYFTEAELSVGRSLVMEANFSSDLHTSRFIALQERCPHQPIQIVCVCEGQTLLERFSQRAEESDRHPGHLDAGNLDEFKPIFLNNQHPPLEISGALIQVDTTDFEQIDYPGLYQMLNSLMA